jgi:hypothetical protein
MQPFVENAGKLVRKRNLNRTMTNVYMDTMAIKHVCLAKCVCHADRDEPLDSTTRH